MARDAGFVGVLGKEV